MDKFMGKELKNLIVTLPYANGTEVSYGVYAYFTVKEKSYFALLPFKAEKELDFSKNYVLYRVEDDGAGNPVVIYIESDYEYAVAANYFAENYLDKK